MKAIIFVRVSTDAQQTESQKIELIKSAKLDGYVDSNLIIIEKNESGSRIKFENREGVKELLDSIKEGGIETVYIWELSRLSRIPADLYKLREILINNNVQLKCLNPNFKLFDVEGKIDESSAMIFGIFTTMAESEIRNKKDRFARGKKFGAENNKFVGGKLPFGYTYDEKTKYILINEKQASIIKQIYNLYENGLSIKKICFELLEKGISVKQYMVNNILMNKAYTGEIVKAYRYNRQYPSIITSKQYDIVEELRHGNSTNKSKTKSIYFGEKLARCKDCGGFLVGCGSKNNYKCYNAYYVDPQINGFKKTCTNKQTISINILDSLLFDEAKGLEMIYIMTKKEDDLKKYQQEIRNNELKLSKLDGRFNDLNNKLARLTEVYIEGGLSKEIYDKKKIDVENEKKQLNNYKTEYINNIDRYILLIDELSSKNVITTLNQKINKIQKNRSIIAELSDREKFKLVHKHIKSVVITNQQINYKFAIGEKMTKAKKIVIENYKNEFITYFFISNNGNGGCYLVQDKFEETHEIKIPYLNRFFDKTRAKYNAKKNGEH